MQTATPTTDLIVTTETAYCLTCGGVIPAANIGRNLIPLKRGEIRPTQQVVRAYCEHCRRLYEVRRELSGGSWVPLTDVTVVTDGPKLTSFLARLAHLRGDIQIDASLKPSAKEGK
jgi:hypothetical protein